MWATLQKVGRSLMMPIAVLPPAALLLRLGEYFGTVSWLSWGSYLWEVMEVGGGAVFGNLPLLFAIGVAIGFTEGAGAAALAAGVGYLILKAINGISVAVPADEANEVAARFVDMGVLGGILMGLVAAVLYDRYKTVRLPDYLAFFGGRRFVPIITAFAAVLIGLAASVVWLPIGRAIDAGGDWIVGAGAVGLLVYGIANRALIPFGLHHILNTLVWFQFGTFEAEGEVFRGDLSRYFAGDPEAGAFMAGWFFIMMFGLPAAAWAIARQADADEREATSGIMNSAGFTSFLTGVTEPIEFSFLFLAPVLYGVHAVLSGIALVVADLLSIRIGFGFSAGLIDYLALNAGLGSNKLLAIPVGLVFGVVYFLLFTWTIRQFDLPTPGRTPKRAPAPEAVADANP